MSKSSEGIRDATEREHQQPVFGVVATGDDDGEITRLVLRARANDHRVLIAYPDGTTPAIPELARLDDVRLVPGDGTTSERGDTDRRRLETAADVVSASGLVVVEDTSRHVDFGRSVDAVEGRSVAPAVYVDRPRDVETLVAIPAYNEAATIQSVADSALDVADEVVVVDDGGTDRTASLAREAGATVIEHGRNRGYGAALATAFEAAADRDVAGLVILDGDGQHDAGDVPMLAEAVIDGDANVAIGSRFVGDATQGIPLYRRIGLGVINVLTNVSMGSISPRSWVHDTQSGFRAYDGHAVEELADADIGDDMDASLDILYRAAANDLRIEELPTVVDYGVADGHSQGPVSHGLGLVGTILRTIERRHPVLMLGVPGFLITFVGLVAGYLTTSNYLATETFPFGLGLSSAFLILLGVFCGFTAIVLHSLQAHLGT